MNTGLLNETNPGYENRKEKLINDVKGVVADAGEMLKDTAGSSRDGFVSARDKLQGTVREAKDQFARSQLGGRAMEAVDTTTDYVKAHPWKSAGIAAAALVAFRLFSSRR
ncbi:MAG: DUF883 family protein [Pseudomonadota bacterium]